jgi:hypothetical protein
VRTIKKRSRVRRFGDWCELVGEAIGCGIAAILKTLLEGW